MDIQPNNQTPSYQPPTPNIEQGNAAPVSTTPTDDPGKTLGIVGFILVFIGIAIVGLPLSIIGYRKSKKAGFENNLAIAGIVLNSIAIFLSLALLTFVITETFISYNSVRSNANTAQISSNSNSIQDIAELFARKTGNYPKQVSDFYYSDYINPKNIDILNTPDQLNKTNGGKSIVYQYTVDNRTSSNATGGRIIYWDSKNNKVSDDVIYIGDATKNSEFKSVN